MERIRLRGWTSLRFRGFPRHESAQPAYAALPAEVEAWTSRSFVEARYGKGDSLELALSGEVAAEQLVWEHGAYENKPSRARYEGTLRELYVAFLGKDSELRLGQQRLAWGVLDMARVNDVANARDLRDPLPVDDALLSLPTPLLRVDHYLGSWSFQGVVGWFVPDRFDLYGRRWAVIQPGAPLGVRSLAHLLSSAVDPSQQEDLGALLARTETPRTLGAAAVAGAKVGLRAEGVDLGAYYQYGYDGTPNVTLAPEFAQASVTTDWSNAGLSTLAPLLGLLDAGRRPYEARYVRRHHVGADGVTTAGPFVLRAEAAYDSQRVFYRTDLTGFVAPVFIAAAGAEYQTGSPEEQLSVEVLELHAFEPVPRLLGYARDTVQVFGNFHWPVISNLGAGLRGMAGVEPSGWLLQPELDLRQGDLKMTIGATLLDGQSNSVTGYYVNAASGYAVAKYAF